LLIINFLTCVCFLQHAMKNVNGFVSKYPKDVKVADFFLSANLDKPRDTTASKVGSSITLTCRFLVSTVSWILRGIHRLCSTIHQRLLVMCSYSPRGAHPLPVQPNPGQASSSNCCTWHPKPTGPITIVNAVLGSKPRQFLMMS
jgi:hypothetical protein